MAESQTPESPENPEPSEGPETPEESEGFGLGLSLSGDQDDVAPESTPDEEDSGTGPMDESESTSEPLESEEADESAPELAAAEEEPTPEPPKTGYLVFPDSTEQSIPPSQWLIGRADLAKFLADPKKANEISRGHLTVFQEGDKYFIEDGTTMVQRKPSTNKTWLVRGSSRVLVTGTGRTELQDEDEIDVAELVKLQFVVK